MGVIHVEVVIIVDNVSLIILLLDLVVIYNVHHVVKQFHFVVFVRIQIDVKLVLMDILYFLVFAIRIGFDYLF